MNRRNFIKTTGALGALAYLPSCLPAAHTPNFKLGYQLFSIRDEMANDPVATLKALKEMGYEDFEHYGFDADKKAYYGFETSAFKKMLDELELTVSSGHYPFSAFMQKPEEELTRFTAQCIEGALTMGSRYITWPWLDPEYRTTDCFKRTAALLNKVGEQVKQAGLGFAYHNHGYEFEDLAGTTGYDIIVRETDAALVKLQLDMYWVMHAGKTTPAEIVAKHPGRVVMWHIKDMHKVSRDYTELGNGSIDYPTILPDPETSGLEYYYIEQGGNYTENSLRSAAASARYFKKSLQQYL